MLQKVHHPHCVQFFGAVTKTSPYVSAGATRAASLSLLHTSLAALHIPSKSTPTPLKPHHSPQQMIVTEFMGCGSLADLFRAKIVPSTRRCVQLALDTARGIAYLHNRQPFSVIHRWGRGLGGGG